MITEDYVSFETAKLLKEKGFTENCLMRYSKVGDLVEEAYKFNWNFQTIDYSAPTLQMACKWLRIKHNIHIEPHIVKTKCSYGYMPNYINLKELKQHFPFDEFDFSNADKYVCITYDKACETAIKYCLENLI
jgi:hypothetical protein